MEENKIKNDASVSIVAPCYNEEDVIEEVVRDCYDKIISKITDSELIIVDDLSSDGTPAILERLEKELPKLRVLKPNTNCGHGKAVRIGYEAATKDWIFQIDSDNQFETQDFWKLFEQRNKYSFILGNRTMRNDPSHRIFLAKIIRSVNRILFKVKINDVNCPFRLVKKEINDNLLLKIDSAALAPNIMIPILAKRRGVKIAEIPVAHHKRKTGNVTVANWKLISFCFKGFRQLLEFRKSLAGDK